MKNCKILLLLFSISLFNIALANDGHELWLGAKSTATVRVVFSGKNSLVKLAADELQAGWQGSNNATVQLVLKKDQQLRNDGFRLTDGKITASTPGGLLYGVFDLLRRQRTGEQVTPVLSNPSYSLRMLNHWDNPDGSIERGYAGRSVFWKGSDFSVTESDRNRWKAYARANASLGINAVVLNNVNASPAMLDSLHLNRAAQIAEVLRIYGIRVFLCINFSSPAQLGGLRTSDPLDPGVIRWWNKKAAEIYQRIPDFGGFLVKANSEGLPGPQDFGRTHADGANMLADALKPFHGLVMWRAFVYQPNEKDRAKQAYNEFMPLDGKFRENVIVQVKNGPVDFQPREPFSPLFGAMKKTAIMPELQITQEYLGHNKQLAFLATMWEECLKSDTYQYGPGSTVARCTDGSLGMSGNTAIAGVANIGLDTDWCGNTFAQANWYAFGRLAWCDTLSARRIAEEWLLQTFDRNGNSPAVFEPLVQMMLDSREAVTDYSMPLGLHHLFAGEHHYGPGLWYAPAGLRKDWTPPYYHQASEEGIGFNRSSTGTNAVAQYHEPLATQLNQPATCPENLLLWFHHLSWDYRMHNGTTLWDALCLKYQSGLQTIRSFQRIWESYAGKVDDERFEQMRALLAGQVRDAQIWKDASLLYFRTFSKRPYPAGVELPVYTLPELQKMDMLHP